ncbi:alanine racemase [Actinomyces sp. W5033]|uniref:alanine racemase n=1 Tax=Actinomyces sp. W5033 TaxID=3446479 RepID=UPI003EDEF2F9
MRPPATTSRAVIDLDALARNARVLAEAAGTPWMAVVKADAYGHGIGPVSLTCLAAGATWLGVAQLAEALHLRGLLDQAGVARPEPGPDAVPTPRAPRLMCWLAPVLTPQEAAAPGSPLRQALEADLDLSVSTTAQLEALAAACAAHVRAGGAPGRVHLKADTGMSRAGAVPEDLPALAAAARGAEDSGVLDVVGLWSHLSRADEPTCGSTEEHLERFARAEAVVARAGLRPRVRHLAATGGLLWHPAARLDLVRVGIGLYGLSPEPAVATSAELGLTPVMRLEAPVTMTKRVPAGTPVSYGGTWRAPTDRWLGLVPLGYSDGVPRHAASAGPVAVGTLRTTVVGKVCMDQLIIDLGPAVDDDGQDLPCPARAGDTAVLWGAPEATGSVPTADEWAAVCGTISYEIVTRLGPHVPRVTVSQEEHR